VTKNRRERLMRVDPTTVTCPTCRAGVGEPCQPAPGKRLLHHTHQARYWKREGRKER